jgi:signal transduction histidine kinase
MWSWTEGWALSHLFRRRMKRRAIQELSRSLALIVDRPALEASVAARIKELFNPGHLILFELEPQAGALLPGFSSGVEPAALAGAEISPQGRLARWLAVNESCLDLARQPDVYSYLDTAERQLLQRLRVSACVPLIALNRLIGLILLGSDRPGWRLGKGDGELLLRLASQASLAFENADLYRQQREQLDQVHRAERLAAVGRLAAGVAHEIRNPLTAIRSTIQYLLQSFAPEEPKHELVRELLGEVDRINSTISGLLSLSRTGEISLVEIDLLGPLANALQLVEVHAREQGIALRLDPGPDSHRVRGDAAQLRQVFLNLLLNAVQAMPQGGEIDVSVRLSSPPDPAVQVAIADRGPGIPPPLQARIFEPFFTTKREGTGLGLAICQSIVEQHQGEIRIDSRAGAGTTVVVLLPQVEGNDGEHPDRR